MPWHSSCSVFQPHLVAGASAAATPIARHESISHINGGGFRSDRMDPATTSSSSHPYMMSSESQEDVFYSPDGTVSKTALDLIPEPAVNVTARSETEEAVRDIVENEEAHDETVDPDSFVPLTAPAVDFRSRTPELQRQWIGSSVAEVAARLKDERASLEKGLDTKVAFRESLPEHDSSVRVVYPLVRNGERVDPNVEDRILEERVLLEKGIEAQIVTDDHDPSSTPPLGPTLSRIAAAKEVDVNHVKWWLYLAEMFGRWGDRMWSFAAAMFLLELYPDSMLLPAIHGFVTGACVILFGSLIGEWVDTLPRVRAIRIALLTQNSCVAMGSFVLTIALVFQHQMSEGSKIWCVVGFILFAIVADCASVAMNVIVENDWIVVIAAGNKKVLADLNATIRRIDLTCQVLSPIIIAQIITFGEHYIGSVVVLFWNLFSMIVEYTILMKIYRRVPRLAFKLMPSVATENAKTKSLARKTFRSCFSIRDGWRVYFKTRVWPAGLGLAFLYMTVMAFGGVTNTYMRTQGLSESVISLAMACGAIVGIAGTFVFPKLREKVGLERTGLCAVVFQLGSLVFCVISIWLAGSPFNPHYVRESGNNTETSTRDDDSRWITKPTEELPSVVIFLFGMIAARFGLWMADLTIRQLIQENVPEKERGVFGGVQSSLNRFMDMLKFILVICLPYPETFGVLIIISFVFVLCGHGFYALHCYRMRGHLLPGFGSRPIIVKNDLGPPVESSDGPNNSSGA